MDKRLATDDSNGTKPTDIIDDGLGGERDADGLLQTLPRRSADDALLMRRHGGADDPAGSRSYIERHPRGMALLVLMGIVVIIALALAWRRTGNLPSLDLIEQNARNRVDAPTYSGGYYGDDDHLILMQVTAGARQHSERAPEGAELEETFGATGYATVDVMLTFQNESVIATKTATLGYSKQNDQWISAGTVSNEQVSFMALAGVDQRKVLHNIDRIIERAEIAVPQDSALPSLSEVYDGATFEVTSAAFDDVAQTDTLTIHASKRGVFSSSECDMVAVFSFRPSNGLWELTDATVTDDAWTRRYDPIVGIWQGTFMSQETGTGQKCLAASGNPLVLNVTSWEESGTGTRVHGTVCATAHFHRNPAKDAKSAEGDSYLETIPFVATLDGTAMGRLGCEAVFTAALPEAVGGNVSVSLQFGTGADGGGVTVTVATEHRFEDKLLIIPYQNQAVYTDTYELQKMPDNWQPEPPKQTVQQKDAGGTANGNKAGEGSAEGAQQGAEQPGSGTEDAQQKTTQP